MSVAETQTRDRRPLEAHRRDGPAPSRVDRSVIALWLGHESVETTQIYLEATLAMKEQALAKTSPPQSRATKYRPSDQLLGFLNSL
jgi:integrase